MFNTVYCQLLSTNLRFCCRPNQCTEQCCFDVLGRSIVRTGPPVFFHTPLHLTPLRPPTKQPSLPSAHGLHSPKTLTMVTTVNQRTQACMCSKIAKSTGNASCRGLHSATYRPECGTVCAFLEEWLLPKESSAAWKASMPHNKAMNEPGPCTPPLSATPQGLV